MTLRRIEISLTLLLLSPSLRGQASVEAQLVLSQAPASSSLTGTQTSTPLLLKLDQAIAMALRDSPRLQEADAITRKATAAATTAKAYSNPEIQIYEGPQYSRPITTPGTPGLLQHYGGTQAIEIPAERRARQRVTQYGIVSSEAAKRGTTLSVVTDVKHAFYNALRRREEIDHAQENLHLVEDLLRRVEVEVNVGEKGRLELTRAQAELARAQFAVRSAQIQYSNAIALLRVTIAAPPTENIAPQGDLNARITLEPIEIIRQRVLKTHPVVEQSKADLEGAKADLERQKLLRIPQPTFYAEFENQPDLRFWRTGFNVPIPLWDRRRGQIDDAKANISLSNSVLRQRQLELLSALERAYEQYQLADQQTTSLEAGSLHAAQSAVDAAKAAYRYGERGIVEVLDAQRVLQSVRGDLLDAQYARQSALIDLQELGALPTGAQQ